MKLAFTNKSGKVVHLDEKMRLSELIKVGIRISIHPQSAPMPSDEQTYVHIPPSPLTRR